MFEVYVDRIHELLPVEEAAHGDFHPGHPALQLKNLDFIREGLLVGFQHADHVLAVFFFAHEQAALHILGLATGLDHIAVGVLDHVFDGLIERIELAIRE